MPNRAEAVRRFLPLPVDKTLHQPLRLAADERLPEHADAEIDGFLQRGWVERSDTHHLHGEGDGFREELNPSGCVVC